MEMRTEDDPRGTLLMPRDPELADLGSGSDLPEFGKDSGMQYS